MLLPVKKLTFASFSLRLFDKACDISRAHFKTTFNSRGWCRLMSTNGKHHGTTDRLIVTQVLPVDVKQVGTIAQNAELGTALDGWDVHWHDSPDASHLRLAAERLRTSDVPVAFPTETVYGLGADATRSEAVQGIYKAKQRPSDNPLIVHFATLTQLRRLLQPGQSHQQQEDPNSDPLPAVYKPLIERFWPGPLTIILPNPANSSLAYEVTAGLQTFGARMPGNLLARMLIKLADVPLAAPSANASTKPSPTTADHVKHDLDGRIEIVIDGGPCDVGVESTVVDGLHEPPVILRPGGISIEQIRQLPGWADVTVGYKDASEKANTAPRAPGMKYRHYSPKATVYLYEVGRKQPDRKDILAVTGKGGKLGLIRTATWSEAKVLFNGEERNGHGDHADRVNVFNKEEPYAAPQVRHTTFVIDSLEKSVQIAEIRLGSDPAAVAKGLFAALRELDKHNVDTILVEGIDEYRGDAAAAIMNRLRKAAEVNIKK